MKKLSLDDVKALEKSAGEPVRYVDHPALGTVVFKQVGEDDYASFERGMRNFVAGKQDKRAIEKNLVSSCLVHPSPVEFDALVKSTKRWKAWSDVADLILEWAGYGETLKAETLGKD